MNKVKLPDASSNVDRAPTDHDLPATVLDALTAQIAIVDEQGYIVAVNRAWKKLTEANPLAIIDCGIGANYLLVCDNVVGGASSSAAAFAMGIRAVISGQLPEFSMEYPCHSPEVKRWFLGRVTPLTSTAPRQVVVAHEDITIQKLIELRKQAKPPAPAYTAERIVSAGKLLASIDFAQYNQQVLSGLHRFYCASAVAAIVVGCVVLLGWALELALLTSIIPGFVSMNPATAVCFIAVGSCLLMEKRSASKARMAGVAIAAVIACLAFLQLMSVFTSFNFQIDQTLFRDRLDNFRGLPPNRMAPNTALNMFLLSLALVCLHFRNTRPLSRALALMAFFIAMFAAVGYLFGVQPLYKVTLFIPMALNTALVFILAALATLTAHPSEGFVAVLSRSDTGGKMARFLIPLCFLVPLVIGSLRLAGQNAGWYGTELGTGLLTVANMIIFSTLIMWVGSRLSRFDMLREENQKILRISEERFRNAVDYAPIGMALVDITGGFIQVNQKLCQIVGMTESELLSTTFQAITHPDDQEAVLARFSDLLNGVVDSYSFEKRYFHKNHSIIWINLVVSAVRDEDGQSLYFISQFQDITDKRAVEEELLRTAQHDGLTGLANRASFILAVQTAIDRKVRSPSNAFGVLFIDLDRFKVINDSMGHLVGDELLKEVARRLSICVRPTDLVARLGGDEFTILLEHDADSNEAANAIRVAQRILSELTYPFNANGKEIYTAASIGIALSITGYGSPADMLRDADNALYRAKAGGKGRYEVFDPAMHEAAVKRLDMEAHLRTAVTEEQFHLCYQPIVYLENGKTRGFEALVRWNHPKMGVVMPGEFIAIAEETALIVPLGRWILSEACAWVSQINKGRAQSELLAVNVNVSPRQFRHPDFVEEVRNILLETEIPAGVLRLEITEGTIVELSETVQDVLWRLRELGIQLQIDDFGTGYSSLAYLHRLPVDALKIDRSFVAGLGLNTESTEITRAILALAHGLCVGVVAEGVETAAQAQALNEMGCTLAQGYYFAKPLSSEAAKAFLLQYNKHSTPGSA